MSSSRKPSGQDAGSPDGLLAHRSEWTPQDTDQLNEALKERIDQTLGRWLVATVSERPDELHAELLDAAEAVIGEKVQSLTEARRTSLIGDD